MELFQKVGRLRGVNGAAKFDDGGNWKYAEMVINAEAPMVAFISDLYPFFPQLQ